MKEIYEILIPKNQNNGEPFSPLRHQRIFDLCVELSGGISILPELQGRWLDKGELYCDTNIPIRVVCNVYTTRKIALAVKDMFHQKAVLFYRVGDNVTFV